MSDRMLMARADDLVQRLRAATGGGSPSVLLSDYRQWLDRTGIPAEVEGWPSEEAYDQHNVETFAAERAA